MTNHQYVKDQLVEHIPSGCRGRFVYSTQDGRMSVKIPNRHAPPAKYGLWPIADCRPVPEWISVEKAMPEEHECVLALYECPPFTPFKNNFRYMTECCHVGGRWEIESPTNDKKVTHWQPLPELPEVENA